jgi:hypothetical protein
MTIDLKRVTELAKQLGDQQDRVNQLQAELDAAKQFLLQLEREDLPTLMQEVGLEEIKLTDGSVVSIQEDCACAITDRTRAAALEWLLENNFGGLIKTEVSLAFGRGDREAAQELVERLRAQELMPDLKEVVHPSTLKAFVKEQLSAGANIPMDLFNVYPYSKAVIKKRK